MIFFSVLFGFVFCNQLNHLYTESDESLWKKHNKIYNLNHISNRGKFEVFRQNLNLIRRHNSNESMTFFLKLNGFAHLTEDEYRMMYKNCYRKPKNANLLFENSGKKIKKHPESVDWRLEGKVSPVKDQMYCGSCWAFSVTGAIESQYLLKYNSSILLSEQQLVDCVKKFNDGCNGGYTAKTFEYLVSHPITNSSEYEYDGYEKKCHQVTEGLMIKGAVKIHEDDQSLVSALAKMGPASIAIDASHASFRFYGGGVYYDVLCDSYTLDHAVLAVGYNFSSKIPYYIVKNSWASDWGENGYINIAIHNNHCGVATEAYIPAL